MSIVESSPSEEGDPNAPICFMAEAPGAVELRANQPLVGPSGQLFNECLHMAGLVRGQSYIVNTIPIRVAKDELAGGLIYDPRNREAIWHPKSGFTSYGLDLIEPQLEKVRKCKANLVFALGAVALDALYARRVGVGKLRGSILWSQQIEKKFIASYHPAAILRGAFLWKYPLVSDLDRARREMRFAEMRLPKRHLEITPNYSKALAYLRSLKREKKPVSVDIEATHTIFCIAFSSDPSHAMCIPWVDERRESFYSETEEADLWLAIQEVLGDHSIPKVGQLFLFDMDYLWGKLGIRFRGQFYDTGVLHSLMFPDFPKGLDFLCSMHTREPYYKDEGKIWKHPFKDLENFWLYNCKDAAVTLEVWNTISKLPEAKAHWKIYQEEYQELYEPLIYMMARGLKVDFAALSETKVRVEAEIESKKAELASIAKEAFNPGSPIQVGRYFYDVLGIKPYLHHTTGKRTTDDKAMARIVRRYNLPEARLVQEIRKLTKLHGTYLEINFDKDNRLRCYYNMRGNKLGRLSSAETVFGTGTNMQNLPSELKDFLVTDREL